MCNETGIAKTILENMYEVGELSYLVSRLTVKLQSSRECGISKMLHIYVDEIKKRSKLNLYC